MNFLFDLRYACRLLRKSWGYSLMCATVVALSVGLAVWTYALAYSQLWKPLPYRGSEHWYSIQIAADAKATARPSVDAYTYQQLRAHNRTADHLGAYTTRMAVLGEGQASTSLRAAAISPRLLAAMRVAPMLGRTFAETDGHEQSAPVAILSFDAWQSYFASDRSVVGRTARIDGAPVQIVGVMPKGFIVFRDYELLLPLQLPQIARPSDSSLTLTPFIVSEKPEAVQKKMQAVVAGVNGDYASQFNAARHVRLFPAARTFNHTSKPIVATIAFLGVAVLLLGCVNISMIFLARLLERSRELALRTALGASRSRILRQCLLETAIVVVAGLLAGWVLAAMAVAWAQSIGDLIARVLAAGRSGDGLVLRPIDALAAIAAALVVWLLSTLVPAWRVSRRDAAEVLAGSGKGTAAVGSNRSVGLLVGLQIVVSCLVLVICANLVIAIRREVGKPTGLQTARVMLSTNATEFGAHYKEPSQRLRYWEELSAAIESRAPGAGVAFMTSSPTRPARVPAAIEALQGTEKQGTFTLPFAAVSENYFELLGITLRSGRLFDTTDNSESLNVAVVDEQLAARYWPNRPILGTRIQLDNGPWLTIVGVVSGVSGRPYRDEEVGVVYRPLRQAVPSQFQLLVQWPEVAANRHAALRAAAFAVDRDLPLHNLQTLDDYIRAVNVSYTAMVPVMIAIALITALLAASGLFGLISRSVAQRTQEVGIRRALGATSWRATSRFRRQAALYLSVSVIGVGAGIMITTLLSGIFTNILERVVPVTSTVVLLMAAVIFTASYLPTRRAVAMEPGDALRYE